MADRRTFRLDALGSAEQETEVASMRTPTATAASFVRLAAGGIVRFLMGQTEYFAKAYLGRLEMRAVARDAMRRPSAAPAARALPVRLPHKK
jgi:hypothetical protein